MKASAAALTADACRRCSSSMVPSAVTRRQSRITTNWVQGLHLRVEGAFLLLIGSEKAENSVAVGYPRSPRPGSAHVVDARMDVARRLLMLLGLALDPSASRSGTPIPECAAMQEAQGRRLLSGSTEAKCAKS